MYIFVSACNFIHHFFIPFFSFIPWAHYEPNHWIQWLLTFHLLKSSFTKQATNKLPIMYLLDSIVKNVGDNYKPLFAKNIVHTFQCIFEKVTFRNQHIFGSMFDSAHKMYYIIYVCEIFRYHFTCPYLWMYNSSPSLAVILLYFEFMTNKVICFGLYTQII